MIQHRSPRNKPESNGKRRRLALSAMPARPTICRQKPELGTLGACRWQAPSARPNPIKVPQRRSVTVVETAASMPTPSFVPFKAGKAPRLGNGALSTAPSFHRPFDGFGCGADSGFPAAISRTSSSLVRPSGGTSPRRKMSNIESWLSAPFCHMWTTATISFADRPRESVSVLTVDTNPPPAFTRSARNAASSQRLLPGRPTPRHGAEEFGVATRSQIGKR